MVYPSTRSKPALTGLVALALTGSLALTGCLDRQLTPIKSCVTEGFIATLEQNTAKEVDVLFVVDNSGSMGAEQTSLRRELPNLVETLATGRRSNGPEFPPVADLHVAVVTTDLGIGFGASAASNCTAQGDDAMMLNEAATGCGASSARYLGFRPEEHPNLAADASALGEQFGCIANVGTGGCGIEQQLDAALKALTPASNNAISFLGNTHGQGDGVNDGFLRANSIVAVILVTDEDDCSATPEQAHFVYDRADSRFPEDLNVRCQLHHEEVTYAVERYVAGLRALRPGQEGNVIFGAITGVPTDLVADPEHIDYDAILNDSRMQLSTEVVMGIPSIVPACSGAGGSAAPARRIVEVARGFGENGIVQSICQEDFGPALDAIIDRIASKLENVCLPRALNPDQEGLVGCEVIEDLPSFELPHDGPVHCADLVGVEPTPVRIANGRESCRVLQVPVIDDTVASAQDGWYYDDFSAGVRERCTRTATPQRIAFTTGAVPVDGAEVRLECLQRVQSTIGSNSVTNIGTFCDANAATDACAGSGIGGLFCEPNTRTCQVGCVSDETCPSAFLCFHPEDASEPSYCVNPICTSS
ncbi:MAG: hypothetical protein IPK60_09835 [Sandaracinaceae bacterium]|nr:hypothetical protein [Sandaracinaceae bacterium]